MGREGVVVIPDLEYRIRMPSEAATALGLSPEEFHQFLNIVRRLEIRASILNEDLEFSLMSIQFKIPNPFGGSK